MELLVKGIAAGFIIAVPLGPVSILCIRRVLTGSLLAGLVTVLGAAAADAIYGLVGALGAGAVGGLLFSHRAILRAGAGLFLLGLGLSIFRSRPSGPGREENTGGSLPADFLAAFFLMLANPTVLISFLAVFAALDLGAVKDVFHRGYILGAGVFLGSACWWGIYKLASLPFQGRLTAKELRLINIAAGSLIGAFGVWQLIDLVRGK